MPCCVVPCCAVLYCASTPPGVLDQCILLCCARIAALPSPRILICRGKALLLCCTVCTSKTPTLLFVRRRVAIFAVFSLVRTLLLPHALIPSTAPLTCCPRRQPDNPPRGLAISNRVYPCSSARLLPRCFLTVLYCTYCSTTSTLRLLGVSRSHKLGRSKGTHPLVLLHSRSSASARR